VPSHRPLLRTIRNVELVMDAVVIGGGHAGLAVSQQLGQLGLDHVVLERRRIAESWRSQHWDSFALNTPSWLNRLPGDSDTDVGVPSDGFLTQAELVERLVAYATRWDLPVSEGVTVTRVEQPSGNGHYRIHTDRPEDANRCPFGGRGVRGDERVAHPTHRLAAAATPRPGVRPRLPAT
jgi:cation diffusion facilitator CzcD-associated flavoprotein CzcO